MAYFGGSDGRRDGQKIHDDYIEAMTQFISWLIDHDYKVRLLSGDDSKDDSVIASVMADLVTRRPDLAPGEVVANPVSSLGDLLEEIEPVGFVIGARYHNVVSGVRLSKPTISVGYSLKHDALMGDMGVPEFALSARSVTGAQLIDLFNQLQSRSSKVRALLETNLRFKQRELEKQYEDLAVLINSCGDPSSLCHDTAPEGSRHLRLVTPSVAAMTTASGASRSTSDFWGQGHHK
jgi:polysaccharide pyruvyl transferase WcaK-like protein